MNPGWMLSIAPKRMREGFPGHERVAFRLWVFKGGASRYVVENADSKDWELVSSLYCREETLRNLCKLGLDAENYFSVRIERGIKWKTDVVVRDRIVMFPKAKDRPVILTALAEQCAVLLTLDRVDFQKSVGGQFYAMAIRTPGDWLIELRDKGLI